MPRVVATAADGSILVDHEVPEDLVMRCVVEFAENFPNLPIYIEGEMLLDEQRVAILHQARVLRRATSRIAEDMTHDEFRRTTGTLRECFEDLRRLHISSARELGLLVQAHNAAVVEEGIRARFYLHQSLEDIDAIDASHTIARVRRNLEITPDARHFTPINVTADTQSGRQSRRKQ